MCTPQRLRFLVDNRYTVLSRRYSLPENLTLQNEGAFVLISGLTITVIGMAIVFCFLIILLVVMKSLNIVLRKFFPESFAEKPAGEEDDVSVLAARQNDLAVVAAAVASIKAHRAAGRS